MIENLEGDSLTKQGIVREAIQHLNSSFKENPFVFFREAELHSQLYNLLAGNLLFHCKREGLLCSLVHQGYPTPVKCDMGNYGFEVKNDSSRFRRGHYDMVVLNPWWVVRGTPLNALMGNNFPSFRKEIRDKAQKEYPPLCLIGIEIHLVRSERFNKTDYKLIRQDYRKLLFSGRLQNGWRFMDHRYMLVYSHHAQPGDREWTRLQEDAARGVSDLKNAWIAWTSPQRTR